MLDVAIRNYRYLVKSYHMYTPPKYKIYNIPNIVYDACRNYYRSINKHINRAYMYIAINTKKKTTN